MRILLITHETSRTGAPRVAAVVGRGLVRAGHDVHVIARSRGPLLEEFETIAPTTLEFLFRVRRRLRRAQGMRFLAFLMDSVQALGAILRWRPDLVYVNSTAAAIYLRPARWLGRRVILHVHESGPIASTFLANARLRSVPADVQVVACSPSVEADMSGLMAENHADLHMIASVPDDAMVRQQGEQEADWTADAGELVVGCCGALEHRKGVDLWVRAAELVHSALPDRRVRFVWVGDGAPPEPAADSNAEFVGPRKNPYPIIKRFDIFTLPSRDDPFPLVVLEAMLLGRPPVAFGVGGVHDQIGDAGVVVEPGDVTGFARAVVSLALDDRRRSALGQAAEKRAREKYSTDAFLQSIDDLVYGEGSRPAVRTGPVSR